MQALITKSVIDRCLRFSQVGGMLTHDAILDELIRRIEEGTLVQADVARKLSIAPARITEMRKRDRKIQQSEMPILAGMLGMSSDVIRAPTPDVAPTRTADAGETVEITRLDLSLPMGPGATVDDYIEEEPVRFDLAYIQAFTRTPAHRLRLARGVGDSMYPTLVTSDLVWIDSTQTKLNQQDRVWAVSINGAAAIKRLRALKAGKVLVISDNPAIDNYEVDADELLIGGRVIRFARDL